MNTGVFISALGAASVELLETAAIAYAIASSGYKQEVYWGTFVGLSLVGIVTALLGTSLQLIPLYLLQIIIGLTLLWFGWGWVKKSVLRQVKGKRAGWIEDPLVSEGITLESKAEGFSKINFIIMTKSAALEGVEVAIVVITLGLASGAWKEALSGAILALFLTISLVILLHGYLVKIPEVLIKLSAGILLMAYGTFWLGEGVGLDWPLDDLTLLLLIGLYSFICSLVIQWLKKRENLDNLETVAEQKNA